MAGGEAADAGVARALAEEARELVRSARALLAEWSEEGVDGPVTRRAEPAHSARAAQAPPPEAAARRADAPTLEQVRADLGECTRCRLHRGRTRIVFGDG